MLDDAPFFLFRTGHGSRPVQPAHTAFQAWAEEFQGIYRFGGFFNLTLHPQLIGRPGRILVRERLIEHTLAYPGVWVATGREVAEYWGRHGQIDLDEQLQRGLSGDLPPRSESL